MTSNKELQSNPVSSIPQEVVDSVPKDLAGSGKEKGNVIAIPSASSTTTEGRGNLNLKS